MPRPTKSLEQRFWEKVDMSGGPDACWPWTASLDPYGYGRFAVKPGQPSTAQRVAFFLEHGRYPHPCGLHTCDNPPCCNPKHIFEGTRRDNAKDRDAKHRVAHGESHYGRKLSVEDVMRIRKDHTSGESQLSLSRDFEVSPALIWKIVHHLSWRRV